MMKFPLDFVQLSDDTKEYYMSINILMNVITILMILLIIGIIVMIIVKVIKTLLDDCRSRKKLLLTEDPDLPMPV